MFNVLLNYLDRGFFYGLDTTFDFLTMFITLFVAVYAYKVFTFVKQKRYLYFAFSFMLIFFGYAARFLFDVFVKIELIDKILFLRDFTSILGLSVFLSFAYFIFVLSGYLVLIILSFKIEDKPGLVSLLFLIVLLGTLISQETYLAFYFISTILLMYLASYYYQNHRRIETKNSRLVFMSFFFMLSGQVLTIFILISNVYYYIGSMFTILAYSLLFINLLLIIRK